jgi:hypothetical protein
VLDPRISYDGMKIDYENDPSLMDYLESSKSELQDYFDMHYSNKHPTLSQIADVATASSSAPTTTLLSPQKNFTSRFQRKTKTVLNELEEYFKLPREDFEICNPIHWWMGRCAQFPNLFWLARDILCIPGMSSLSCLLNMLSWLN